MKIIDFSRILWWFQTYLYKSICGLSSRSSNPKVSSEFGEVQILRGSLNHLSDHLDTLSYHLSDH